MATYGLRPAEIYYLLVHKDDGIYLWCDYVKRTGGGYTQPRRLEAFHLEWERDWQLIERLEAGEALPRPRKSMGTPAMEYLRRKTFFKDVYAEGAVTKSFRHSYSKRCHQQYGLILRRWPSSWATASMSTWVNTAIGSLRATVPAPSNLHVSVGLSLPICPKPAVDSP